MWQEEVVFQFEVLFHNLPVGSTESTIIVGRNSGLERKPEPSIPVYELRDSSTLLRLS